MEPIILRVTCEPEDVVRGWRRLQLESLTRPRTIIPLMALLAFWVWITSWWTMRSPILSVGLMIGPFVLIPLIIWLIPIASKGRIRKLLDTSGPLTYEFSDDYVSVKDASSELKQKWNVYSRAIVTKSDYILVCSANRSGGRIIPRRAFESPEQEAAFRELLVQKLNFKG